MQEQINLVREHWALRTSLDVMSLTNIVFPVGMADDMWYTNIFLLIRAEC